jgi:hypothetical protein
VNQLQWLVQERSRGVGVLMTGNLAELDPLIRGGLNQNVFRSYNKRWSGFCF